MITLSDLRLFKLPEAAERLHVSVPTLRRLEKRGDIRTVRIGWQKFVEATELLNYLRARGVALQP